MFSHPRLQILHKYDTTSRRKFRSPQSGKRLIYCSPQRLRTTAPHLINICKGTFNTSLDDGLEEHRRRSISYIKWNISYHMRNIFPTTGRLRGSLSKIRYASWNPTTIMSLYKMKCNHRDLQGSSTNSIPRNTKGIEYVKIKNRHYSQW